MESESGRETGSGWKKNGDWRPGKAARESAAGVASSKSGTYHLPRRGSARRNAHTHRGRKSEGGREVGREDARAAQAKAEHARKWQASLFLVRGPGCGKEMAADPRAQLDESAASKQAPAGCAEHARRARGEQLRATARRERRVEGLEDGGVRWVAWVGGKGAELREKVGRVERDGWRSARGRGRGIGDEGAKRAAGTDD